MKKLILVLLVVIFLSSNAYADQFYKPIVESLDNLTYVLLKQNEILAHQSKNVVFKGLDNLTEVMIKQNEILEELKIQISSQTEPVEIEEEVRVEFGEPYKHSEYLRYSFRVNLDIYIKNEFYKTIVQLLAGVDRLDMLVNLRVRVLKNRFVVMYDIAHDNVNGIISYIKVYDKYPPFDEITHRL